MQVIEEGTSTERAPHDPLPAKILVSSHPYQTPPINNLQFSEYNLTCPLLLPSTYVNGSIQRPVQTGFCAS